jgi:mlo protein
MLLGFISLLLTVSQNSITKTCVPENVVNDLLPCRLSEKQKEEGLGSNSTTTPKHYQSFFPGTISGTVRRLLAEASEANLGYCAKKVTFIYFLNYYCCCSL